MLKEFIKSAIPWMDQYKKIQKYYKKAHNQYNKGHKNLANFYAYRISKKYGCYISPKAELGENFIFPHPIGIVIGEGVKIGNNCVIYENVTLGRRNRDIFEYPTIGDNVIIYSNATLVGDIYVGDGAVIGCNAVVLKSVDKNSICVGVVK